MNKKIKDIKEEVMDQTVIPKKRVQTAEGWKRAQLMKEVAKKSAKTKAA